MTRLFFVAAMTLAASPALAKDDAPATKPAAQDKPGDQDKAAAQPKEALKYQIIEAKGKVAIGPIGLKVSDPGWVTAKVGDYLLPGNQIWTSLRSAAKLVAVPNDPPTVIMIERLSVLGLSDLAYKNGTAFSRILLYNGAIRAGVLEGSIRSDMEITCAGATLSKKGTDIFRIEYRDGKWNMSLSEQGRGLIQAIQHQRGQGSGVAGGGWAQWNQRFVSPGNLVTNQMLRTIESLRFDRLINTVDAFGLEGFDVQFMLLNNRGLGMLLPGGNAINLFTSTGHGTVAEPKPDPSMDGNPQQGLSLQQRLDYYRRNASRPGPYGDFGVGQVTLPPLPNLNSSSSLKPSLGVAKPNACGPAAGRK